MDSPSPARMYDYFLGGSFNFLVDREAAGRVQELYPDTPYIMRANRAFLRWLFASWGPRGSTSSSTSVPVSRRLATSMTLLAATTPPCMWSTSTVIRSRYTTAWMS